MIREGYCLLRCREFYRFFWIVLLLLAWPAVSLWAAEGTVHLTFQKAVPGNDNKQVYVIKSGDSVVRILRKLGWGASRYRLIRQLNPHITDLNRIYPGQKLILTRPGEQGGASEVSNYTTKEGDSITRIIISELHTDPSEAVGILRLIKQLNPEITDFNKIYPGQIIRIPRGQLPAAAPVKSAEVKKPPVLKSPPATDTYVPVIRQVIEQFNGKVTTSGNHYISLPESGQITVDCAIVPIVDLGEGTTIMLDHGKRMPDVLAGIIQASWKNYHLVRIAGDQGIASVLQEIFLASPSFLMVKVEKPLSSDDTAPVQPSLDWLITRKSSSGSTLSQLGLILTADKSPVPPSSPSAKCAMGKDMNICEILGEKVQGPRR